MQGQISRDSSRFFENFEDLEDIEGSREFPEFWKKMTLEHWTPSVSGDSSPSGGGPPKKRTTAKTIRHGAFGATSPH